jgi:hypothetical protein
MTHSKQNEDLPVRESSDSEFKERIDVGGQQDWCEIVKDVVAIANSGGGQIIFGLRDDGKPSGWDPAPLLAVDPAHIVDKIAKYTGEEFDDFEIKEAQKGGQRICVVDVRGVRSPMVFTKPGTYEVSPGKQKTAFAQGTVYFRHGAKSAPGNSKDLRHAIEREVNRTRSSWLGNIRKVVKAPAGSGVKILPPEVVESEAADASPIRIVDDPKAPAYRKVDPDKTHPYRLTEVVEQLNKKLGGKKATSFDIQCVRKSYAVDTGKPQFFHKPRFSSPQYSEAFVEWMTKEHRR